MPTSRLLAFPLTALLLALAVWLTATVQRQTANDSAERIAVAARLKTAMLDQETGLRGFLLTQRKSFLEPYVGGARDYDLADLRAHQLMAGDRQARAMLTHSEDLAERWRQLAATQLAGDNPRPNLATALRRKALMDDFRRTNADLQRHLGDERRAAQDSAALLSVVISLVIFLIVGGVGTFVIRRRDRAQAAADAREREYREGQAEFIETMQAVDSEQEARALLRRHLERWTPGRKVTVLNRNNSDNRLEITGDGSLDGAEPRACVAIRLARSHEEREGDGALLECELCGKSGDALCSPLLVSGRVIGSVLVRQDETFDEADRRRVHDSVASAAPVIGNLRAVAIAETRAATDALTGLPNRRAANDTLKRMVAHAQRAGQPLCALALDLDHFKQINDRHGHDRGDEVLAAVSVVMASAVRASDFVARHGGEEFLILAPDTDRDGGLTLAEKLRAAISRVEIPGLDGKVTASIGVAALPGDAIDGDTLLRKADRALYAAKERGRDRVESAATPAAVRVL